jgi:hypothetical protein
MSNFLKKINIENFKMAIAEIFRRTPLTMFISIAVFALLIIVVRVEDMSQMLENNLHKAIFSLSVAFFFSVAIYLYGESKNISKAKKELYQISTFIFGFLFFYFFEENLFSNFQVDVFVYFILTILGVIAFVFIAPFVDKLRARNLAQEEFYIATYNLLIKTLMSIIVGLVTMFLGFIALSAIFSLFNIEFIDNNNWYAYWAAFSLSLFAPIFFLANLAIVKEREPEELQNIQANKFYSFLINYVGLPAIFVYFLILYSYTIKVLIHFSDWPQGEIAWLVILFSFFGYLVYFASFAFSSTFKPAKILRQFLPTAILIQTLMLFYAIGLHINQYDLTINRYLVVAFGLWLFGLSLYFIISKKKNLSTIFYSLLITVIFISIGPWSVYLMPEQRQKNNLENNLKIAKIMQEDGGITPLLKYQDISEELSGEIYSAIDYLCNFHGCDTLNKYFSAEINEIKKEDKEEFDKNKQKQLEQAEKDETRDDKYIESIEEREYQEIRNWTLINKLTEKIKVRKYTKNLNETPRNLNFRNNDSFRFLEGSIDVSGYEYFIRVSSEKYEEMIMLKEPVEEIQDKTLEDIYSAVMDIANKKLDLYFNDKIIETFQIEESVINSLLEKKNNSLEYINGPESEILLSKKDMTFYLSGNTYDLKLVLNNINIRNPDWKEKDDQKETTKNSRIEMPTLRTLYVNGYVLIKTKSNK